MPKARKEGAAKPAKKLPDTDALEEKVPEAKPGRVSFAALVEQFKAEHPEEWEAIALTPTQHGVEVIAKALK